MSAVTDPGSTASRRGLLGFTSAVWLLVGAWTVVAAGSLGWYTLVTQQEARRLARQEAATALRKDMVYRLWGASHGGVYVPVTESTPPSPYLAGVPERDIVTPSGRQLTLLNPAYVTRQVHEVGRSVYGACGHITSLDPIRTENARDPWERSALEAFKDGAPEVSGLVIMDGAEHMRLMRPMVTEKSCLKCHAEQGYEVGDVRGGISVSVPMAPHRAEARAEIAGLALGHGLFWILGVAGIMVSARYLRWSRLKLQQSEEKFRQIYETSGDAIMIIHEERYIDCNQATLTMFGCKTAAEFLAKHPGDVSPPTQPCGTDSTLLASEHMAAALRGERRSFEWEHRRLDDGTTFPAEVLLNAFELEGRPVLQAVVRDVSERVRQVEEIRQARERADTILGTIQNGVLLVDAITHEILECNPAAAAMIGLPAEAVVGRECHTYVCPSERGACPISDLHERCDNRETVLLTGSGARKPVLKSVAPLDLEGRSCYLETFVDISDRKAAETALQEQKEIVGAISASAQDAIVMIDSGGKVTQWNLAAERIFGYTAQEVIGRVLHDFIAPEPLRDKHNAAFPHFVATGRGPAVSRTLELPGVRKDGTEVPVELSLSATRLHGQWHAIGIMRDISERKRAEEELRRINEDLEEKTKIAEAMADEADRANAAKSMFLANMSHEIRTPMNGVIGMTGLLLDTELNDEQRHFAEVVQSSGDALLHLIDDILDFSKIEADKLDLEELDFDLRSCVEECGDLLGLRAQQKGLEFVCAIEPDVPTYLRGDPGRLRQILINLSGNAIKFTGEGEVSLRVSLVSEDEAGALLRFTVHDTGVGIPEDKAGLVFGAFQQVDPSTTRKFGGTGLGLAISKRLAEMMGGEMGVESVEGAGSTFWFTARMGKQHRIRAEDPPTLASLEGVRVLTVDDNATNREAIGLMLGAWGASHEEAASAQAALAALTRASDAGTPFQLAILDVQMPDMNGRELARVLRSKPAFEGLRLVMATSIGRRGDAAQLEAEGFAGYLTKPIKQSDLHDCLATVLGLSSSDPETSAKPENLVTKHSIREDQRARYRILLAEDNAVNREVALKIIEKLGYRADPAANGREALSAMASVRYDLVLMDVQMPEMDGFEASAAIRAWESATGSGRCPIVAMTANALEGDRERCLEKGMDDYIPKPVAPAALLEMLERWLPRNRDAVHGGHGTREPHEADGVQAPPWDLQDLRERVMGDEALVAQLVDTALDDLPRQLRDIEESLGSGDLPGVQRHAHTIKGAAATLGAEPLRRAAERLELAARGDERRRCGDEVITLTTCLDQLRGELERYRAPDSGTGDGQ